MRRRRLDNDAPDGESRTERLRGVDVLHLTFDPPFGPGSYTSLVAALLDHDGPCRQAALSYWDGPGPAHGAGAGSTVRVGGSATTGSRLVPYHLPERFRRRCFDGIGSKQRIRYALDAAEILAEVEPPVVVVWDDYHLGAFLRRRLDETGTLVLSQHGRSYHLPPAEARDLYSLRTFDAVISLTRASYATDRERVYAYEPLVLIRPNGVDVETFQPAAPTDRAAARARWNLPADGPVVLALARLAPSKGAHILIHSWPEVMKRVPDAFLWLVGAGPPGYAAELRRHAAALGISDRLRFQGAVDAALVPTCHAAADLYVLPSLQDEGHPLSLLEAMSSGLGCVASDNPVVRELHADTVELVRYPNVQDAFVEPVVRLLLDPGERSALGRRAREQVLDRFTLDHYLRELDGFLSRLVASAKPSTAPPR